MLPHSLVLTHPLCDYCEKPEKNQALICDNFGIKTCEEHYELGKRDCETYMHLNNMIHLQDVKQLVDALPETFCVKRSSGEIQDGWSLDLNNPYVRKVNGEWHLTCVNKEYNLTKKPSIHNMTHLMNSEFIQGVIAHLDKRLSQPLQAPTSLEEYKDDPCIQRVMVGGVECRVVNVSHPDLA